MKHKKATKPGYHEYLLESLKVPEEAAGYLTAAFEEGEPKYFLKALRNVAEARGGLTKYFISQIH